MVKCAKCGIEDNLYIRLGEDTGVDLVETAPLCLECVTMLWGILKTRVVTGQGREEN